MRYRSFEWLVTGVGAAAILSPVLLTVMSGGTRGQGWDVGVEIAAQVMLLAVLVGAVHWGRKGGFIVALSASLTYIVLRLPTYKVTGATTEVLELIALHTATYGLVGILGGELSGRVKYFFARLENSLSIDDVSGVFNERSFARLLAASLAASDRYGTPFSVLMVTLSPNLTGELRPAKVRVLVRAVADYIRNDVRMVDDVGRLEDGRFLVLLPSTARTGADTVRERVQRGVRDLLGAKDDAVSADVYSIPEDSDALRAMADSITPPEAPKADTPG